MTSAPLGTILPEELCPSLRSWGVERPHADLCRHELYVALDLDAPEWDEFEKFTLRLSWPAFVRHPGFADIWIDVQVDLILWTV